MSGGMFIQSGDTNSYGATVDSGGSLYIKEPSITGATAITASDTVTFTAGRMVAINCTVAGNSKFGFADGTTITVPVAVGLTIFPWAVNQVFVTGTTATATYSALL